jgi:Flp pilus assembly protein CpaB
MTDHADVSTGTDERRIRRRRPLPGGRAVVGALLVTAAAIGVFTAYADAASGPSSEYVIAGRDLPAGTVVPGPDEAGTWFTTMPAEILGPTAARVVTPDELAQLAGQVIVHPLVEGDPILHSVLTPQESFPSVHFLALALAPRDALGGVLLVGQHVDVLVTYGSGRDAWTEFVARSVRVVTVDADAGGGIGGTDQIVTVSLESADQVQRVGHAARAGAVFLSRPTAVSTDAPAPFRPDVPGDAHRERAPGFVDPLHVGEAG